MWAIPAFSAFCDTLQPCMPYTETPDGDELRRILLASRLVELADGASTYVIHILASLDIDPVAVGCTR